MVYKIFVLKKKSMDRNWLITDGMEDETEQINGMGLGNPASVCIEG